MLSAGKLNTSGDPRCIGVFDSGIGGLTVVRELQQRLPHEHIVYFGDTARVPYGIKSAPTISRFAREDCDFLLRFDPKMIVVACNTVSATALPMLKETLKIPICGVVEPGAREAIQKSSGHTIAVIATEATIGSDAYRKAMSAYLPGVRVIQKACPLFVPLVEEGRPWDDPISMAVVRDYIEPIMRLDPRVLVLGCTHYPLLREAIVHVAGEGVCLVDSGEQTARAVIAELKSRSLLNGSRAPGKLSCFVSDNPQRFRELGQRFLDRPIIDVSAISQEQFLPGEVATV